MILKRMLLIVLVGCAFTSNVKAQFDAQFSQYWISKNYYNPAAIGLSDELNLSAQFRQQWVGVENAPQSFVFNAEMPAFFLGKNQGIGLMLFNENIGLYQNLNIGVQYAYSIKLFGGQLNLGLQPSVISSRFDGTKVHIPSGDDHNPVDPNIPTTEESGLTFDMSFGLFYHKSEYYLGLSYQHIFQPEVHLGEKYKTQIPAVCYILGGYNYQFPYSLLEVKPSFLFKTDFNFYQLDLNLLFMYNKRLFGGIGYRLNDAVNLCAGFNFGAIKVGYSYDIGLSKISRTSKGSHEIFATYSFPLDFKSGKLIQGRKRSVRFL